MKTAYTLVAMMCFLASSTIAQKKISSSKLSVANKPGSQTSTKPNTAAAGTEMKSPSTQTGSAQEVVAIYPFTTSRDYSYDYAMSAGNAVEAGFVRSKRFTVVERNRFGSISNEERFVEANTAEIIKKAAKFGAKTIVTGHVVGVSKGDLVSSTGERTGDEYMEMSMSFKIIDVETGQIKLSEIVRARGTGTTSAAAAQAAYTSIDKLARANVASYLPQRFKFMSIVAKGTRKKGEYLDTFKIWGGSENGLKVGDVVEVYTISHLVNPNTNQRVEEKSLVGQADVVEVNSGSTATCAVIGQARKGSELLNAVSASADNIVVEFRGNSLAERRSFMNYLMGE